MFLVGRTLRFVSCVLIAALLFAQAAFATQPCVESGMSAAAAPATPSADDCCATAVSAVNLCVMKCTDSAQSSAHAKLQVPPAPVAYVTLPAVFDNNCGSPAIDRWRADHPGDPPKSIRFCSFLL